jgi:hypothetical protein
MVRQFTKINERENLLCYVKFDSTLLFFCSEPYSRFLSLFFSIFLILFYIFSSFSIRVLTTEKKIHTRKPYSLLDFKNPRQNRRSAFFRRIKKKKIIMPHTNPLVFDLGTHSVRCGFANNAAEINKFQTTPQQQILLLTVALRPSR